MYIVIKDYPAHGFKKGEIVGMNKEFAKKLIKEGIIELPKKKEEIK